MWTLEKKTDLFEKKKKKKEKRDEIYDTWEGWKGSFQEVASLTMPSHAFCSGPFVQCWAGLPPTVLGLSVTSKGVGTRPIYNLIWSSLCTNYVPFVKF